jgi:Arc/MetJ-type ribon-helix-helix transcriptional regulator
VAVPDFNFFILNFITVVIYFLTDLKKFPIVKMKGSGMRSTITISVPEQMKEDLEKLARADGISRSDIVRESLRDYLFIRNFRAMRKTMVAKASADGIYTDQDVFDRMS